MRMRPRESGIKRMIGRDHVWRLPPAELTLMRGEVHVWRAELHLPAARIHELRQTLSADETIRAEQYYFQEDRQRFIVARGVLRAILGRYLQTEPSQVRFCYSAYGKPAIESGAGRSSYLNFNIAHSGQLALFALTLSRQIGVDLERVRVDLDYEQIAERFFSPHERRSLRAVPDHLKSEAFFNCWTRKEAYVKARGAGLSTPLDQFTVSLIPGEPARLLNIRDDPRAVVRWSLWELRPGPGYAGALAVAGDDSQLRCWRWPE
jgi:4'-phosphopantetheinyl transferase